MGQVSRSEKVHLYSVVTEVCFGGQRESLRCVRIMRLVKQLFQLLQLLATEYRPAYRRVDRSVSKQTGPNSSDL